MQLLATSPEIVFDNRYPSEYRFLSYFARMATMMTEPFDEHRHAGVTPFFFGDEQQWGPIPFRSEVLDTGALQVPLLRSMWEAWSETARAHHPGLRWYAEKLAVEIDPISDAAIPLCVVDLVRDPRDVLASIRAFTAATAVDGFGRAPGMDERDYVEQFIATFADGLARMSQPRPAGVEGLVIRYEDLVTDLGSEAERLQDWLGVQFDPARVEASQHLYAHHTTSASPAASIGRWRHELSDDDAQAVTGGLGELLRPFGYQL